MDNDPNEDPDEQLRRLADDLVNRIKALPEPLRSEAIRSWRESLVRIFTPEPRHEGKERTT